MAGISQRGMNVLAFCSAVFAAAAVLAALVFHNAPKQGIAIVAALSWMACVAVATIGAVLAVVSLIGRTAYSRLAAVSLVASAVPLGYCAIRHWRCRSRPSRWWSSSALRRLSAGSEPPRATDRGGSSGHRATEAAGR